MGESKDKQDKNCMEEKDERGEKQKKKKILLSHRLPHNYPKHYSTLSFISNAQYGTEEELCPELSGPISQQQSRIDKTVRA